MKPIVAVLVAAALLAAAKAGAQQGPTRQAAASPEGNEPYEPGIGEIMALQQMRHIKLWFAGDAGNWPLADYEIDELKEGFAAVDKQLGRGTVEKMVGARLSAVEKAVEAKDSAAFTAAFDNLSAGCNSCHHLLDHGFIVIRRPTLLPYTDQAFTPLKR